MSQRIAYIRIFPQCYICGSLEKIDGHIICSACTVRKKQLPCECANCVKEQLHPLLDPPVYTTGSDPSWFGGHAFKF